MSTETNPAATAALHGPGLTDVRAMIVVHDAFRRSLHPAAALVRAVAPGDRRRAGVVADHVEMVLEALVHHHESEDELLWPTLLERVPDELAPIVHLMESQHEGVHGGLEEVLAVVPAWRANPTVELGTRLADRVEHLVLLLEEHLQAEERHLLPIAARTVTEQEWAALGERGLKETPLKSALLVFGAFLEVGHPDVVKAELAKAPAPVRLLMPLLARRLWQRYQQRLFQGM